MYRYAYLVGNLILFVIWLFLFIRRKDLRKEMLFMGLLFGPLGPISELWYLKDYWRPEIFLGYKIGFEDYIFMFLVGGGGGVLYEQFLGKKLVKRTREKYNWLLGIFFIIMLALWIILNNLLGINSIYTTSLSFVVIAVIILLIRHDLVWDSLMTGIFATIIGFCLYHFIYLKIYPNIISDWWMLHNISGILIATVPLEELLWSFSWGMMVGPLYEFWQGYRLKSIKR